MMEIQNRTLFQGNNIDLLKTMDDESVDLIATDPPFNKHQNFGHKADSIHAGPGFRDIFEFSGDEEAWLRSIQGKNHEYHKLWLAIETARVCHGENMAAFCCFTGYRLLHFHRILRPTGALVIQCDDTASHYMKTMLDATFGKNNYRNEIVWKRAVGAKNNTKNKMGRMTDRLFYYAKSPAHQHNTLYTPHTEQSKKHFDRDDNDGKGAWKKENINSHPNGNHKYPYKGFSCPPTGWRHPIEKMRELDKKGLLVFPSANKPDGRIMRKSYLSDSKGIPVSDLWTDISPITGRKKKGKTGYATQKPVELYERVILFASNVRDMVLDPFAGSGTTLVAAAIHGRQWIGMDRWEGCAHTVSENLKQITVDFPHLKIDMPMLITVPPAGLGAKDETGIPPIAEASMDTQSDIHWMDQELTPEKCRKYWLKKAGDVCQITGAKQHLKHACLEVDRKHPGCEGGKYTIRNTWLITSRANSLKADRVIPGGDDAIRKLVLELLEHDKRQNEGGEIAQRTFFVEEVA